LVNRAFKIINGYRKLAEAIREKEPPVWPFTWSHESTEKECFRRPDGLWQAHKPHYCGDKFIFLWRLNPNYCIYGQPHFGLNERNDHYTKSETCKVLFTENELTFKWEWYEWDWGYPNKNIWGLKMTEPTISVYKGDERIYRVKSPRVATGQRELTNFLKGII
jgi:hypothetical protein